MAIDPDSTPKDFTLVIYDKTEVDTLLSTEAGRVDLELAGKIDTQTLGSPVGTATLDSDGTHTIAEVPIASAVESLDPLENTKVMTPERVHYVLEAGNYSNQHTYDYTKVSDFTVTGDVYETVAQLTTPIRNSGVYELKLSMSYSLNSTNTSAYFRFSTDGGTTWFETRREPKDNTDKLMMNYSFPYVQNVNEVRDVIIQSRKENTSNVLEISFMDIVYEWKRDI